MKNYFIRINFPPGENSTYGECSFYEIKAKDEKSALDKAIKQASRSLRIDILSIDGVKTK